MSQIKRLLFLTGLLYFFLLSVEARAQYRVDTVRYRQPKTIMDSIPKAKIGAKIGGSFNRLSGNLCFNQSYTEGVNVGGYMDLRKKKVGLQVEAMVSTSKHAVQDSLQAHINPSNLSFIYLDIPVLFELKLLPCIWLQVGPQIGTMVSANQSPGTILDPKTLFESNDFSGVIGLEAKVPIHRSLISLGARYIYGFSNINNGNVLNPDQSWKTTSIQVYLGFQIL